MSARTERNPPKQLTSRNDRAMARRLRDAQWEFMERVAEHDPLWVCWWNKNGHHDEKTAPPNLEICGLIDGMELLSWMATHRDWWKTGRWSDKRYAAPVRLTEAGRAALTERHKYDMEPVTGGLVEPGWMATPARQREVSHG